MRWLDALDRRYGSRGVPEVTAVLIACQVLVYALKFIEPGVLAALELRPERVWAGEVWRLVTFLAAPPLDNPLFAFFFWYLFYLMGTALEHSWGALRYNVFLAIGYLLTVAVALGLPWLTGPNAPPVTNAFLQGSVFLAFAWLFPDFELYLFFLLPVKIRWLALLAWIGYVLALVTGDWTTRLVVLASIGNWLAFFGGEAIQRARGGHRRMTIQARSQAARREAFHRCAVCGKTDLTDPDLDFRYCVDCDGQYGYCPEHLHQHAHVKRAPAVEGAQTP